MKTGYITEAVVKTCVFTLQVETNRSPSFIDITGQVLKCVSKSKVRNGFVLVYSKHTTAAIRVIENEPLLINDLTKMLEHLAPRDSYYQHNDMTIRTVNVGDEDKFSLHAAYICEECGHATKTTEGNLGFIYILPADGGGHYSFRCTPPLDQHQTIR